MRSVFPKVGVLRVGHVLLQNGPEDFLRKWHAYSRGQARERMCDGRNDVFIFANLRVLALVQDFGGTMQATARPIIGLYSGRSPGSCSCSCLTYGAEDPD